MPNEMDLQWRGQMAGTGAGKEMRALRRPNGSAVMAVLAMLTLVLQGCTSLREYVDNGFRVGPDYRKPPADVAADWIDANDVRIREDEDDAANWWTVFQDPILDDLVHSAYEQNITLREAGFRVLGARAQLGIATGAFFPQTQTANGDFFRSAVSKKAANRQFTPQRYFSQWDFGFSLAWELDFWGRFRRAIEAADDNLDASIEDYDDVLVTLIGDVAINYVTMRTLEQQLIYLRQNVELQRITLGIAQARFQGGQATELDVDQAQSTLSQTEAQLPETEIQIRQTTNQLCVLLGLPSEDLQARLGPGVIPTAPLEVVVGIPADLLRRRPDVRREERRAAAQCQQIGIAEADFYPAITINGSIGTSAQDLGGLTTPAAFLGSVGPSFQWKLLNYGRIKNNVLLQEARFQELVARYQNRVLEANREVEDGLVQFLKAQQRAKYLKESVDAAERAVKVALAQYEGGLVDFNRVSLIQQNLVQQQNTFAQARGEIAEGLILTYKALGGGWQIREEDPEGDFTRLMPMERGREPVAAPGALVPPPAAPAAKPAPEPKQP